jgi:potassium/chloride transporter 9
MAGDDAQAASGHASPRKRPNFSTRTAVEDGSRLAPTDSPVASESSPLIPRDQSTHSRASHSSSHSYGSTTGFFGRLFGTGSKKDTGGQETNGQHDPHGVTIIRRASLSTHNARSLDALDRKEKNGPPGASDDASEKLGTFSGVFVPTTLNVLSILMFLRFGFILGQSGVFGMLGKRNASSVRELSH